jgi:hypothetical protein
MQVLPGLRKHDTRYGEIETDGKGEIIMCQFISYIKKEGEIYFLTTKDIESKKGKELRDYCKNDEDLKGHGAIRKFFDFTGGKEFECEDFSTPDNFPPQIVSAIKKVKFSRWFGPVPKGILRAPLYADYQKKLAPLYADHEKKLAPLYADYQKKLAPLYADYQKKLAPLYADYQKKRAPLYADYQKKLAPLDADHEKKRDTLDADYQKKRDTLDAETWMLATKTKNRTAAWR